MLHFLLCNHLCHTFKIVTYLLICLCRKWFDIVVQYTHTFNYGCLDELGFYVPSTVFQSFRDDGSVKMKCSVQ